jgi:hypothetical protein
MKVFIDDVIENGEVKGKLYIESDERQFVVKEYNGSTTTDKKGKVSEVYKNHGHFTNIDQCVEHIALRIKTKESTATTLLELAEDVKSIKRYIRSKFE